MAWQMGYTDENDNVYPQSYWKVASVENMNFIDRIAVITFLGYKSQAAKNSGKPPVGRRVYVLRDAEFDAYTVNNNTAVRALCYDASLAIQDVVVTPAVLDQFGRVITPQVVKSFFEGAVAV